MPKFEHFGALPLGHFGTEEVVRDVWKVGLVVGIKEQGPVHCRRPRPGMLAIMRSRRGCLLISIPIPQNSPPVFVFIFSFSTY